MMGRRAILAAQVRVGLETADAGTYQRQVGYMRLLGELYAYKIVDSRYLLQATAILQCGSTDINVLDKSCSDLTWKTPSDVACRTVFDALYTLLAFGHESPESTALIDPPSSYFRCSWPGKCHEVLWSSPSPQCTALLFGIC